VKTGTYKLPSNFGGGLNYLSQDAIGANESPGPVSNWAPFVLPKSSGLSAELHGGIETLNKFPGTVQESHLPPRGGFHNEPHYNEGFATYRFPEDLEHPEGGMRNQILLLNAPWSKFSRWVVRPELWHLNVENGNISKPEDYPSNIEFYANHRYVDGRGVDYFFPHGLTYNILTYKDLAIILPFHEMMTGYYGHWKTNVGWNSKDDIGPVGAMGYGKVDPSSNTTEPGLLEPTKHYYYFVVWTNKLIGKGTGPYDHLGVEGGIPRNAQLEVVGMGGDILGATASATGSILLDFRHVTPPEWADGAVLYRTGPHNYAEKNGEYMSNVGWRRRRTLFDKSSVVFNHGQWTDTGSGFWDHAPPIIYRNAPVARSGVVWQDSLWLVGFPESPFIDYPPKPSPWDGDVFHPHWLIRSRPGTFNFADHNYGWNYIDLGSAGGDVVGIAATETQLLVFRTHQIHRIRVYGNSYENRIISTDKGIWNQQAIATDGENVYFYDYLGNTIWRYNGVDFQDVGFKLSPYLQREQSGRFGRHEDAVRSIQQNYRLHFFDGRLYVSRFWMGTNLNPGNYETHVGVFRGNDVVWTRVPWGAMFFADTGSFGSDGLMGDIQDQGKPALLIAGKLNKSNPLLLRHNDVTKYENSYTGETLQLVWPSVWSDLDLPGFIKRIATIRFNVEHYRESGGDTFLRIFLYKDHEKDPIWETTVTIKSDIYKYEVVVPDTVRGECFQIRFSERDIEEPEDYLRVKAPVQIEFFYNENQYA